MPRIIQPSGPVASFDPELATLSDVLPPHVALLCVTNSSSPDGPALSLNWHYKRTTESAPHESISPELPLSGLSLAVQMEDADASRDEEHPWEDTYYDAMNWWLQQDALVTWVRELLTSSTQPRLVIWDNTAYDIPWELFYHQPQGRSDDEPHGWLGALVPVIRWTSVHDGERVWRFSAEEQRSEGGLLMLEDETLKADSDVYPRYLIEPPLRTMHELMHRLNEPGAPFGLLVIRCHGLYSNVLRRFTLGGLALNRYTDYSMTALRHFRTPVLLNACASGQTLRDTRSPGHPVRSFVELFLRRGASAVIAVTGDIDIDHSHDFATRLLWTTESGKANLASILQQHRKHYANKARRPPGARDTRTEEDFQRFFASFLYVYYGHPDTTLRVVCRAEEGAP
ncbi:hypothetical protein OG478_13720 [Streptomyces phaeochromogenes]|uniref:hypothetical protein n=1 Tax=Streptomyces phaeochromogenes TaxID=1923 RepID=UPI0038664554|nr:hypothetical protein OG478_13720 [Streptomyces phaeochromogenes]